MHALSDPTVIPRGWHLCSYFPGWETEAQRAQRDPDSETASQGAGPPVGEGPGVKSLPARNAVSL